MTDSEKRIPPFGLRLPPDLKQRVQEAAIASNRSMNAEIIARLERSFMGIEEWERAEWISRENSRRLSQLEEIVKGLYVSKNDGPSPD